jgi:hypothetical protein
MARREAVELVASAERRVRELDDETERIWAERHRIVDDARDLAAQLLALAHSAAERFPADEEDTASEEEPVAGEEEPVAAAEPRVAFEPGVEPLDDTGEPTLENEPDVDATARLPRLPDGEEDTLEDTR